MVTFLPLGGANEIGANCYYLNINGSGIILDCGMHPKKTGLDALPNFELLENRILDYVLISHAHQDHINALPFLIKRFPHLKIVATPQTRAIAELTLHNAISILEQQIENKSFSIYTHDEVDLLIKSIDYKSYNDQFNITGLKAAHGSVITAEFYDAGHVLGSAGILIEYDGTKFFYSGDINLSSQSILNGASLSGLKVKTIVLECTYGATDSSKLRQWEDEIDSFVSSLNNVINRGGSVLIPVFSLGKMQEVLAIIYTRMEMGKLTRADIYTGGIGKKISRIYDYNRYVVNRKEIELILHDVPQKSIFEISSTEDLFQYPSIILASSGMMIESTVSFILAKRWLTQRGSAIFTVGYMDEDTPGYKIAKAKKGDNIKLTDTENEVNILCDINNYNFSAHSKREELLKIVKRLNPDNVVLIHGDQEAIDWIGASIIKMNKAIKVYAAEMGKELSFA